MKDLVQNIEEKVHRLILLYDDIKKKKEILKEENIQLKKEISKKEDSLKQLEESIKLIRISKSTDTQDAEKNKASRQKINEYVREIDKCIALLNE
tara:strand:+ start:1008 stop:1292 length:285 start_codon:yes stop_codon:yes gene_type:complete